jgi:hypothetical protein
MENVATDASKTNITELLPENLAARVQAVIGPGDPEEKPVEKRTLTIRGSSGDVVTVALRHIESITQVPDQDQVGLEIHTAGGQNFQRKVDLDVAKRVYDAWVKELNR